MISSHFGGVSPEKFGAHHDPMTRGGGFGGLGLSIAQDVVAGSQLLERSKNSSPWGVDQCWPIPLSYVCIYIYIHIYIYRIYDICIIYIVHVLVVELYSNQHSHFTLISLILRAVPKIHPQSVVGSTAAQVEPPNRLVV